MNSTTKSTRKKWLTRLVQWGVAAAGIWWVLSNMSWSNRVLIAGPGGWPTPVRLAPGPVQEDSPTFDLAEGDGSIRTVPRVELLVKVDGARATVLQDGVETQVDLLAQKVRKNGDRKSWSYVAARPRNIFQRFLNLHPSETLQIKPSEIVGPPPESLPYPLIDRGIGPMLHEANAKLLILAFLAFPIALLLTAYRWDKLLKALDIRMTMAQAFALNMVGAFYNTFMPGSTGGDVLKAYYASKLTPHRTRAVMSVVVDRVIGLLALVILGGTMSAVGYFYLDPTDPARRKCAQVAIGSAMIILGTAAGLLVFYAPPLRRLFGLDWIIQRLPMQRHVQHALETMEIYRRRPRLVLWSIIVTLPVHSAVVISATFAGKAFNLPLHPLYYWVVVPVVVLAASIPISAQGAGVMEFFAILLTKRQGCTVSQAVALTMSIRLVQILWNLTGGIFVLRGGYHAPSDTEKHTMAEDIPDQSAPVTTS